MSDYAFRIGGDEFALLLPQTDTEQASAAGSAAPCGLRRHDQPRCTCSVGLGLDYGVAVYPDDGEQREFLMRVADDRLYKWKVSTQPRAESAQAVETQRPETRAEKPAAPIAAQPSQTSIEGAPAVETPKAQERSGSERRKWERISLTGTRSYASLQETSEKTARVLDLGYGGVALEVPSTEALGATFYAVLHVPILPPVRVSLRCIYVSAGEGGPSRMGCAFVS